MPKKTEVFLFFEITNVVEFKEKLNGFTKHVTSAHDAQQILSDIKRRKSNGELNADELIDIQAVNIAFSGKGLKEVSGSTI